MEYGNLIEKDMLQKIQDKFCYLGNISAYCVDEFGDKITGWSGETEDIAFFQDALLDEQLFTLFEKVKESTLEEQIIEDTNYGNLKIAAIGYKLEGKLIFCWLACCVFSAETDFYENPVIKGAKRIEVTGNPLRPDLFKTTREEAKKTLQLDDRPVILVFGGSLGASYFNKQVISWIGALSDKEKYQIIISAGKSNYKDALIQMKEQGIDLEKYKNIRVLDYIYDMASALNGCDMIIGRSGSSVSEMTALKKPAILVPSPNVAGNHQEHNARAMERCGAAKMILEKDLSGETLGRAVEEILENKEIYSQMEKAADNVGIRDAADRLYKIVKELTKKK